MLLAHVSDLHIGRDAATDRAAERVAAGLLEAGVGLALVTGDVTHRGRTAELARFEAIFRPLLDTGRLVMVPGNHDRLGDDAAAGMMRGGRVDVTSRPGVHVVRLDSTAPHNRFLLDAHGHLDPADVDAVEAAVARAPAGALTVLCLHHHLHPIREDLLVERLATLLGWPNAAELRLGQALLGRLRGRCDLVLHGHRHAASALVLDRGGARPLRVLNAGASGELGRVRLLTARAGTIVDERWLDVRGGAGVVLPGALADGRAAA